MKVPAKRSVVVTIKMPEGMMLELEEIVKKRHFMDISEEIRSIIRQKWISMNPELPLSLSASDAGKPHDGGRRGTVRKEKKVKKS